MLLPRRVGLTSFAHSTGSHGPRRGEGRTDLVHFQFAADLVGGGCIGRAQLPGCCSGNSSKHSRHHHGRCRRCRPWLSRKHLPVIRRGHLLLPSGTANYPNWVRGTSVQRYPRSGTKHGGPLLLVSSTKQTAAHLRLPAPALPPQTSVLPLERTSPPPPRCRSHALPPCESSRWRPTLVTLRSCSTQPSIPRSTAKVCSLPCPRWPLDASAFNACRSLTKQPPRLAEAALKQEATKPQYSLSLLNIVNSESLPINTRLAAALAFKNFIRFNYVVRVETPPALLRQPRLALLGSKLTVLALLLNRTRKATTRCRRTRSAPSRNASSVL